MYDTVLVPSDGSEHAVRAAEHGAYLARAFDATVHLLHVVDVQAAAGLFDAGGVDAAFVERLEAEGEAVLDAAEAAVGDPDRVRMASVRGEPSGAILEYADEHGADLVAMGTHGRTGMDRYVTGSVTERVVRLAEEPVLTVRATERSRVDGDYTDVLVPTDGSEHAAAAVEHAVAVAERTGARVHAVSAVDAGRLGSSLDFTPVDDLRELLETAAERATEAVVTRAEEAGLDAVAAVREGRPSRALLGYADEHGVDLIAMGTRGRTGIERYLLGSTTARTVRRSEVPVLAVDAGGT